MQKGENIKNTALKKQISATILALCVVLLVLTSFNFVFPVKAFFLGAFGFTIYPIIVFAGFFAFCVLRGQKFVYSIKYLVFLFLCFFFLVCILQIIFTMFTKENLSYGQYLANCFNGLYTPGGVVVGVFTYPIASLLHNVAGIVFYSIALIVSLYFVISYLQGVKEQKNLEREIKQNKYKNYDNISSDLESEENEKDLDKEENLSAQQEYEENVDQVEEEKLTNISDDEDSIFIKDDKEMAKQKLGLSENTTVIPEKEMVSAQDKLFGFGVNAIDRETWQNRAVKETPQKFMEEDRKVKDNPIYEKNKEYLKTLYQFNLDSSNPIINAEDYEDYKEKMRGFNEVKNVPFKRELDVNQTLLPKDKMPKEDDSINTRANTYFEPYKKIANDRGGFDNFESSVNFNNNLNRPDNNRFGNNFANTLNTNQNQSYQNSMQRNNNMPGNFSNNYNQNQGFQGNNGNFQRTNGNFQNNENKFSTNSIEGLDDYIKPISDKARSPLNPNNFGISDYSREIENDKSDDDIISKPFDTSKLSDGDVGSVMGSTINLKQQPSNVYNLPKSFNSSDYRQLEIMGTEKDKKSSEPNFRYDDKYVRPPIDLLEKYINEEDLTTDHQKNIEILERVLEEFKIPAKVEAVRRGSAVTRYELRMPVGIPVRKIHQHASDIALALAAPGEIRIETPIKGKSAVGIEVPNSKIDKVGFRDIIESSIFQDSKKPLTFALGKDIDGTIYCCDLASMPHLLVAGSTGSGKSVCLNALILSLIYRTSPEDLRLILVDPKRVEFAIFNNLPHLLMPKAITEPKKALNAFDWLVNEMERRYTLFQECYVKNIGEYNSQPEVLSKKVAKLPYIVLIVDEFADLVLTTNRKELEEKIMRITQKARAAGIHVILATQRPNAEIITGSIKINLPSRIAFAVTSYIDSKVILDQPGAEKLLGRGDMLYSPQSSEPVRVQGCFVDTPEVKRVVDFVKEHNASYYDQNVENIINSENGPNGNGNNGGNDGGAGGNGGGEFDSLMPDALKLVIENGQATISMLQRRFAIGFSRAARIIDQMETAKFISSSDGSKPRNVYITMEDYEKLYGPQN